MDIDTANKSPAPTRPTRRRPRGKGIRVRTGCLACRHRHLKCDETQPICHGCQKAARECVYPHRQEEAASQRREASEKVVDEGSVASTSQQLDGVVASTAVDDHAKRTPAIASSTRDEHVPAHQSPSAVETAAERQDAHHVTEDLLNQNDGQSTGHLSTVFPDDNAPFLTDNTFGFGDQNGGIEFPDVYDAELFGISPEASFGGWPTVSAEAASRWWFDLLAGDTSNNHLLGLNNAALNESYDVVAGTGAGESVDCTGSLIQVARIDQSMSGDAQHQVILTDMEIQLLDHYVSHLSGWIDITDPDRQFAIIVPELAMKNQGLASAILALSSLHLSLRPGSRSFGGHIDRDSLLSASPKTAPVFPSAERRCKHSSLQIDPTTPVQYYNETLHYLQQGMGNAAFLRSDELLATVLIISTFEMIETQNLGSAWDKHLKGVFWIQRSQVIHGESEGLKQRIWWSWLRQDIYAAFRRRRQILSFYKVTRACTTLNFWELVDRAVYLLGQCVNYASIKEEENGRADVQRRLDDSAKLWQKLEEFSSCFQKYDRRLPTSDDPGFVFKSIWINPAAASMANDCNVSPEPTLTSCRSRHPSTPFLQTPPPRIHTRHRRHEGAAQPTSKPSLNRRGYLRYCALHGRGGCHHHLDAVRLRGRAPRARSERERASRRAAPITSQANRLAALRSSGRARSYLELRGRHHVSGCRHE
jgi:hypothetical protein